MQDFRQWSDFWPPTVLVTVQRRYEKKAKVKVGDKPEHSRDSAGETGGGT